MAEKDRLDVLGLYIREVWQRTRVILGKGMEVNY
jgi:hypothetical protein